MGSNFGFNLLAAAQCVIGTQDYQVKKWLGKTQADNGQYIDNYAEPESRKGSVQPVSRSKFQNMGLDFSKIYIQIFDVDLINVINRTDNADEIIYDGGVFKAMPNFDWGKSGNWNSVLCVRLKDA